MDEVYPGAVEEVMENGKKKRRELNEMAEVEIIAPSDASFEEKDYEFMKVTPINLDEHKE